MRRILIGVALLALGLILQTRLGDGGATGTRARSSPLPSPPVISPPAAGTLRTLPGGEPAVAPGTRQPPPDQLAAAARVATAFLGAYATDPGCESDPQLVGRLRPFITERLAAELSQSAAPPCSDLGPSVGHLTQLTSEGLTPDGHLGFIAQVQAIPTAGGDEEQVGLELFLRREPGGWRVDEVRG
jgi:hypothetical protein